MAQAGAPDRGGPPAAPGEAVAEGEPVRGRVSIAPELAARAPAGAVLFIIARRSASGPPLAVKRIDSPRLPLEFEIGPNNRMIQTMPFLGPIQLTARLDGDGNATTRTPGDLQGAAKAPVDPGAEGVEIELGEAL
jgi:cytochrome c-type biogenesis protein CcmH